MSPPKDILKVTHLPGLEPEEQPLTREVEVPISVKGSLDGKTLGQMGSQVEITQAAGEFADTLRRVCSNCKHFNRVKAQQVFQAAEKTEEGKTELRNLHSNLYGVGPAPLSLLDALAPLGYCHALSEFQSKGKAEPVDVIVHPLGGCAVKDFGDFFKPIDRAAEKRGDKGYDQIMRMAEGKANGG